MRPNPEPSVPGGDPNDEFAVIDRLRSRFEAAAGARLPEGGRPGAGDTWIGDDAAVVTFDAGGPAVLATDLVVEGVHFDLGLCAADDVGYKALMVSLSDLAAMGASPEYALVSMAGPPGSELDLLGAGVAEAAEETACIVVGGDLSQAPLLVVSTAVFGSFPSEPDCTALLRSGASVGDQLFVTGPLGGAAAGLRLLRGRGAIEGALAGLPAAYRRPAARLAEGDVARRSGATAAIDISDGLVADVGHLAEASAVGIALDLVPVLAGATTDEALHGGEEYELIIATREPPRLVGAFEVAGLRPPIAIGQCTGEAGALTLEGRPVPLGGWRHHF